MPFIHSSIQWRHWSRRGKPLGKSERRWLSHFDILAPYQKCHPKSQPTTPAVSPDNSREASRARLNKAMENANAILDAAKRDPRFISEVEKMNEVDGMLGSSYDAGTGGVDDTLEDLRWYVYQRECVPYLRDGLDEVPETLDDDALLGAIDVRMDGKRKNGDDNGSTVMENVEGIATNGSDEHETLNHLNGVQPKVSKPDLISFREDEHMGEAPFEEIKAGFEDGELTEECIIFHKTREEWIPIEEFILAYEEEASDRSASCRKRNLSAMTETCSKEADNYAQSMGSEKLPSCEWIHSMKIDSAIPEAKASPTSKRSSAMEKREKKKPSRDCTQWGQSSVPHIVSTETRSIDSSVPTNGNCMPQHEVESRRCGASVPTGTENVVTVSVNTTSNKSKKNGGKIKPPAKMMRFITQVF